VESDSKIWLHLSRVGRKNHYAGEGQEQLTGLSNNDLVIMFPRQGRILVVVSYAIRVVSKERMRLVLARISCLFRKKNYAVGMAFVSVCFHFQRIE
jgi:hypothetical protein